VGALKTHMENKTDGRQEYIKQSLHRILQKPLTLGSERRASEFLRMLNTQEPARRLKARPQ
jgi:hypothetical protein